MNEAKKNKPVDRIRVGAIEASIWENPGKNGSWKSVTLVRTYKDKDGKLILAVGDRPPSRRRGASPRLLEYRCTSGVE